jgi:uncharacterized NAD(P)/FAD-binding protein YdhS
VAIVGAGASGVLVALHLIREKFQGRITLIDRNERIGDGIAYATRRPEHLLNVIASRMSAFDDDPEHFVRYLESRPDAGEVAGLPATFAQRLQYSDYLRATLDAMRASSPMIEIIQDEVVSVRDETPCQIAMRSGAMIRADTVVLALGNWPRAVLRNSATTLAADRIIPGWQFDAVAGIDPLEDVCIAGSGLSMVDAVLTLAAQAHAGTIHVVSRHGLMPLPHAAHGHIDVDLDAFNALSLARRARHLRMVARAAQSRNEPWQWLMDTLRAHNVRGWQTLSETEQRRFLRHAARYWDVHRHRIPMVAEQTIQRLRHSGQLQIHRGRLDATTYREPRFEIGIEHHGRRDVLRAGRLIDCTGLQSDISRVDHPLMTALRGAGIVQRGAHGIGMATDSDGALIGRDGAGAARFYTLGSARIGQLWESVAVPELRQQAAALARRIVGTQGSGGETWSHWGSSS